MFVFNFRQEGELKTAGNYQKCSVFASALEWALCLGSRNHVEELLSLEYFHDQA